MQEVADGNPSGSGFVLAITRLCQGFKGDVENHGKSIVKLWDDVDVEAKTMGKPQEDHGKMVALWWFHGGLMLVFHGMIMGFSLWFS